LFSGKTVEANEPQGALSPTSLAALLTSVGGVASEADILADVQKGAPCLPDGTIPLLPYIVWLYNQAVIGNGS
jgi:hypothetical protein